MLKWLCTVLPIAALGCYYDATDTLKAFYQAIAQHDCEKAVALAEGYSMERCRNITELKLAEPITVLAEKPNKIVLNFQVTYQQKTAPTPVSKNMAVTLKQIDKQWKVDFSSLREKEAYDKITEPLLEIKESAKLEPQVIKQNSSLLSLWQAEQLLGKAGEEKIHWLRSPDYAPPLRTQTHTALPPLKPDYLHSIRRVKLPSDKKWIALTFDLCERADEVAGYDRAIINTLREKNVKATFYAGGKWMQSHPEKTQQLMADERFEIGNHGWTHGNLRVLQGEAVQQQIVWTQAEYQRIRDDLQGKANIAGLGDLMTRVPLQPATLRFPFGTCSAQSLQATNDLGLSAVQWDVVSGDPAITVQAHKIVQQARAGSIVIFHANGRGRGTAAALPRIIDDLHSKGFQFVTVSELLAAGTIEAVDECYELKRGDNLGYDAQYGDGMARLKKAKAKPNIQPDSIPTVTVPALPAS